jgi:hypothetical protein
MAALPILPVMVGSSAPFLFIRRTPIMQETAQNENNETNTNEQSNWAHKVLTIQP